LVEDLFRAESARLTAALTRILGPAHLELAADATQDALLAALRYWPTRGVPANPQAWLLQVARLRALDLLRRDASLAAREAQVAHELEALERVGSARTGEGTDPFADDQLRMMLLCCHPALSPDSRVALTLKLVAGFGVAEIARAFLADEGAIAQRLVRAKRSLREADAPLVMPSPEETPARLQSVLEVLYLMFNEGHTAYEGDSLLRRDLCQEALRLAELLLAYPATTAPRVHALAALFCFHAARLATRTDAMGALVRLPAQDRGRWDGALVARGLRHLDASAQGESLSPYHLEAEIAALHATAPSWEATDWERILSAYDVLLRLTGSDVVALNRVVALWQAKGAAAARSELAALANRRSLAQYHLFHAVHGELLAATSEREQSLAAFREALRLARLEPERVLLAQRLIEVAGSPGTADVDSAGLRPS
jgi:RNA polymerase sigma-70 factor (ECF subfamily)